MSSLPPPDPDSFVKGVIFLVAIIILYQFLTNGMRMMEQRGNLMPPSEIINTGYFNQGD